MNLWLDDVRPAPDGWVWAKTVDEAVALLQTGKVEQASLDHDLGVINMQAWRDAQAEGLLVHDVDLLDEDPLAPTGYDFCLWMAEYNVWPTQSIKVHSANGIGAKRMCGVVDRYGPYNKRCRWAPEWN